MSLNVPTVSANYENTAPISLEGANSDLHKVFASFQMAYGYILSNSGQV